MTLKETQDRTLEGDDQMAAPLAVAVPFNPTAPGRTRVLRTRYGRDG
jgi:hypothetical protein